MMFTIRTTTGRENAVIDSISNRVKNNSIAVKSLFHPEDLRGYVFIEGEIEQVETAIKSIPHIRGLISREVKMSDIERFLVPEKSEIKLEVGDIIEIIGSPFKGEKAKITRVDDTKSELTVEFLEAAIPIPVTISMNSVRLEKKRE